MLYPDNTSCTDVTQVSCWYIKIILYERKSNEIKGFSGIRTLYIMKNGEYFLVNESRENHTMLQKGFLSIRENGGIVWKAIKRMKVTKWTGRFVDFKSWEHSEASAFNHNLPIHYNLYDLEIKERETM